MVKTFGSLKIGDVVYLHPAILPYYWTDESFILTNRIAIVTYLENYGDYIFVSYKNERIHHTIKVDKSQTLGFHCGRYRKHKRGKFGKHYKHWAYNVTITPEKN